MRRDRLYRQVGRARRKAQKAAAGKKETMSEISDFIVEKLCTISEKIREKVNKKQITQFLIPYETKKEIGSVLGWVTAFYNNDVQGIIEDKYQQKVIEYLNDRPDPKSKSNMQFKLAICVMYIYMLAQKTWPYSVEYLSHLLDLAQISDRRVALNVMAPVYWNRWVCNNQRDETWKLTTSGPMYNALILFEDCYRLGTDFGGKTVFAAVKEAVVIAVKDLKFCHELGTKRCEEKALDVAKNITKYYENVSRTDLDDHPLRKLPKFQNRLVIDFFRKKWRGLIDLNPRKTLDTIDLVVFLVVNLYTIHYDERIDAFKDVTPLSAAMDTMKLLKNFHNIVKRKRKYQGVMEGSSDDKIKPELEKMYEENAQEVLNNIEPLQAAFERWLANAGESVERGAAYLG